MGSNITSRRNASCTSTQDARTRERDITPQRKIVHVKSWYITSSSDGTKYISGLLYGHTRHRDGTFKTFPYYGSVNTGRMAGESGTHEYLLDKSQAEEIR